MQNLIKNNLELGNDHWNIVIDGADINTLANHSVLPIAFWHENGDALANSEFELGALIGEGEKFESLLPFLESIQIIVFDIAKFADGRAFTQIQQLRSFHHYQGEIRVSGDVMPDQVHYFERVGVDSFACRNETEMSIALSVKEAVSVAYQADARESLPLFRRR